MRVECSSVEPAISAATLCRFTQISSAVVDRKVRRNPGSRPDKEDTVLGRAPPSCLTGSSLLM